MWFASCELWYETFLNAKVKEQSIARSMLWHAMSVFTELKEERHNEEEFVDYAVAMLKCRYFDAYRIVDTVYTWQTSII